MNKLDITVSKDAAWLVRTTNRHIFGPYTKEQVEELLKTKKLFLLDELSNKGETWEQVKNLKLFKDICLEASSFEFEEDTVNLNEVESQEMFNKVSLDISNQKQKHTKTRIDNMSNLKLDILPPQFDLKKVIRKKSFKPTIVFFSVLVTIVISFLYNKKNHDYKIIDQDNGNFYNYFISGRKYEDAGFFNIAYKEYKKALSIKSDDINLLIKELTIRSIYFKEYNIFTELNKLFTLANTGQIRSFENQSDILNLRGILYYVNKDYDAALNTFNQAMVVKTSQNHIFHNIGMSLFKQKKYEQAIDFFNKSKRLSSNINISFFYEGIIYLILNNYNAAYNIFSDLVILEPNNRVNYIYAAYAKYLNNELESVIDILNKAIYVEPHYREKHFFPLIFIEDESYSGFLEIIEISNKIKNSNINTLLALMYLENNNIEKALSMINKKIITDLTIISIINFYNSNYLEAKKTLSKALELDYSNTLAHLYLGKINFYENNYNQALNNFLKAQANNELMSLEAMVFLGDVYNKFNKPEKAIEEWKKVLNIDNRYKPAWQRILEKENI